MLQATDFTSQFGVQPTHFPRLGCIGVFVWVGVLEVPKWRPLNAKCSAAWVLRSDFSKVQGEMRVKQVVCVLILVCKSRNYHLKHLKTEDSSGLKVSWDQKIYLRVWFCTFSAPLSFSKALAPTGSSGEGHLGLLQLWWKHVHRFIYCTVRR